MNTVQIIDKLESGGLNTDRIKLYQDTFDKEYNEKILYLRYKDYGHWAPRDSIVNNIKKRYQNKTTEPKILELKNEPGTSMYNLTQIGKSRDLKIFYELYLKFPEEHNINDHMLSFNLMIGHRTLISITNLGSKVFCTSHRSIVRNKKEKAIYYPIYLFECMEKGFLDINDVKDHNMYLVLDYAKRSTNAPNLNLDKIQLYCMSMGYPSTLQLQRNYVEYCMVERNSQYLIGRREPEWVRVVSRHTEALQMPGDYNVTSTGATISTKEKWICPMMYVSFLWESEEKHEKPWPQVRQMEVSVDKFKIEYASSRIITDNNNNFHSIWFFPDSDDDFIKDSRVFGINLTDANLDITAEFDETTRTADTKVCLGILSFNVLVYYHGDCKLVYK